MWKHDGKDCYEILGVLSNATQEEIKQAWKFCVQAFHPDRFSEKHKAAATKRAQEINDAYDVLSDPIRRANYDRERAPENRTESAAASHSSPSPAPPTGRQTTSSSSPPPTPPPSSQGSASRPKAPRNRPNSADILGVTFGVLLIFFVILSIWESRYSSSHRLVDKPRIAAPLQLPQSAFDQFGRRTYQVTGPVLEMNDSMIAVQKGKNRWEIARAWNSKVVGQLKVGAKVTITYAMTAAQVGVKPESFPLRKFSSVPPGSFQGFSKAYQATGVLLEMNDGMIAFQKQTDRWEVARNSNTKIAGALKVGAKATITYTMTARKVEVKPEATIPTGAEFGPLSRGYVPAQPLDWYANELNFGGGSFLAGEYAPGGPLPGLGAPAYDLGPALPKAQEAGVNLRMQAETADEQRFEEYMRKIKGWPSDAEINAFTEALKAFESFSQTCPPFTCGKCNVERRNKEDALVKQGNKLIHDDKDYHFYELEEGPEKEKALTEFHNDEKYREQGMDWLMHTNVGGLVGDWLAFSTREQTYYNRWPCDPKERPRSARVPPIVGGGWTRDGEMRGRLRWWDTYAGELKKVLGIDAAPPELYTTGA